MGLGGVGLTARNTPETYTYFLCITICTCLLEMDLHTAAEKGNLDRVRLLVEQGADKDKGDNYGSTPLRLASRDGHVDVVRHLVEQGASLDKADEDGYTPLSGATCGGYLEIARYLLEQGADRDTADNEGLLPSTKLLRRVIRTSRCCS